MKTPDSQNYDLSHSEKMNDHHSSSVNASSHSFGLLVFDCSFSLSSCRLPLFGNSFAHFGEFLLFLVLSDTIRKENQFFFDSNLSDVFWQINSIFDLLQEHE